MRASLRTSHRVGTGEAVAAWTRPDPGLMVGTGLGRTAPALARRLSRTALVKRALGMLGVTMGSVPFSGEALARIAVDPAFAGMSGRYLQSNGGRLSEARPSATARNAARARRLWADCRPRDAAGFPVGIDARVERHRSGVFPHRW